MKLAQNMIGKRFLSRYATSSNISEFKLLEISPSGRNYKVEYLGYDKDIKWYSDEQLSDWILVDVLEDSGKNE